MRRRVPRTQVTGKRINTRKPGVVRPEHHRESLRLVERECNVGAALREKTRLRGAGPSPTNRAHGLVKALPQFDESVRCDRPQQCRLVFEMPVRSARRHAHHYCRLPERKAFGAMLANERERSTLERGG